MQIANVRFDRILAYWTS